MGKRNCFEIAAKYWEGFSNEGSGSLPDKWTYRFPQTVQLNDVTTATFFIGLPMMVRQPQLGFVVQRDSQAHIGHYSDQYSTARALGRDDILVVV